jgi:KaiC/GvpD/RAD55 family RecA-like ATPase
VNEPEERLFGIPAVDRRLLPVLPRGGVVLVLGEPGSGAALLAKQFAAAGAGDAPVVYFTTNERTEDAERAFREFGWDPAAVGIRNLDSEYFDRVLARHFEVSRARERGLTLADVAGPASADPPERPYSVAARILTDLGGLESGFRLALDSVDFLSELLEPAEIVALARQVRHRAIALGGRALLVLQTKTVDARTLGLLEEMADLVVEVTAEPAGDRYRHRLAIRKVRNHPERTRIVECRVTPRGFELAGERTSAEGEDAPSAPPARERVAAAGSAVN